MKIERNINGERITIELTEQQLRAAYDELEAEYLTEDLCTRIGVLLEKGKLTEVQNEELKKNMPTLVERYYSILEAKNWAATMDEVILTVAQKQRKQFAAFIHEDIEELLDNNILSETRASFLREPAQMKLLVELYEESGYHRYSDYRHINLILKKNYEFFQSYAKELIRTKFVEKEFYSQDEANYFASAYEIRMPLEIQPWWTELNWESHVRFHVDFLMKTEDIYLTATARHRPATLLKEGKIDKEDFLLLTRKHNRELVKKAHAEIFFKWRLHRKWKLHEDEGFFIALQRIRGEF